MNALAHLEEWLEREHPGFADDKKLHAEARALSVAYTEGGLVADDAAASVAYLAHFGPRAIAAVSFALSSTSVPSVVVDVGAGSGASALALAAHGAKRVVLVERNAAAIATARKLLRGVVDVDVQPTSLEKAGPVDRAGLVASAFSFGEMSSASPIDAFRAIERLAPNAKRAVLVDAGDRVRARRIQELRDALVVEGRTIEAPCPHADPCPALVRVRDWCHTRIAKELPDKLARFARNVGRDDEAMSLSYLVVTREPAAPKRNEILALGDALVEKGRARLPVCGPDGLRFVQALKRDRDAYDALVQIERGTRLHKIAGARNAAGDTILTDGVVE